MKNILYQSLFVVFLAFLFVSCSSDDENTNSGFGSLVLEFDNAYGITGGINDNLILGVPTQANSSSEKLTVGHLKYIVSNVVLSKADGSTFTYPKEQSYFIANEEGGDAGSEFKLNNIPAGDYTKVTFGIGVDKEQFDKGAAGAGDFLAVAQKEGMLWTWSAGYKFVSFEGTFVSPTVPNATPFKVHTGQTGTDYNYTTVTLDLPTKARVTTKITPTVHLIADANKIVDGVHKIKLSDNNGKGMGAEIMSGANLPLITENVSKMFKVDHVHND